MIRLRRGKWMSRGLKPGGISETTRPCSRMRSRRAGVLLRIDVVDPARHDRDGPGAVRSGGERALMRRAVDPAREAGDHAPARRRQPVRQVARQLLPLPEALRAPTMATHGSVSRDVVAEQDQARRRILDRRERRRVVRLAQEDIARAELRGVRQLRLDLLDRRRHQRPRAPAALRQFRQPGQRLAGRSEAMDQPSIVGRPDLLAAREAQAVEAFLFIQCARFHTATLEKRYRNCNPTRSASARPRRRSRPSP